MIYNLCKEMLITHVARPRSPFVPPPRWETSALSSDFGEGGWRAAVRPNPNGGRSSPASHSDHIRDAGSVRAGPAFGQRRDVYVHVLRVRATTHLLSAYCMVVCENRKLWLVSTWFSLRDATAVRPNTRKEGRRCEWAQHFFFHQLITWRRKSLGWNGME